MTLTFFLRFSSLLDIQKNFLKDPLVNEYCYIKTLKSFNNSLDNS